MGEVLTWRRRGYSRTAEQMFDDCGFTVAERASFEPCGAVFYAGTRVFGCRRDRGHENEHHGGTHGQWGWSDGDSTITR
jgi:hypothetical protein